MNSMTNTESMKLVADLMTLGVRARIEERISTNEDGTRNIALSVIASIRDASGNGVLREWETVPTDLVKEVAAMRKELKAASKLTAARVTAERGSR